MPGIARRKDPRLRQLDILGTGESSFGGFLLAVAKEEAQSWLRSAQASDLLVELTSGGHAGTTCHQSV